MYADDDATDPTIDIPLGDMSAAAIAFRAALIESRNARVMEYRRLAGAVAHLKYRHAYGVVDVDDAFQEGILGLMRASEKYAASRGYEFTTYATYWIRQFIQRGVADATRMIRVPGNARSLAMAHEKAGRLRGDEAATDPPPGRLRDAVTALRLEVAHVPIGHLEASSAAWVEPDGIEDEDGCLAALAGALARLDDRKRRIVTRRFGLDGDPPSTLVEVGRLEGVSRERIRQIERQALGLMRTYIERNHGDISS